MKRHYLKKILYGVAAVFILTFALLSFFLVTTPGLYTTIKIANFFIPGKLSIQTPKGRLVSHFSFAKLVYEDDTKSIQLINGKLAWHPAALYNSQLSITDIQAEKFIVDIKDTPEVIEETQHVDFAFPKLPVDVVVNQIKIDEVHIKQAGSDRIFDEVSLQATLTNKQWVINQLAIKKAGIFYTLNAQVQPYMPFSAQVNLKLGEIKKRARRLTGKVTLQGNWTNYQWHGQFSGPATGQLHGRFKNGQQISMHAEWQDALWPINAQNNLLSKAGHLSISGTLTDMRIVSHSEFEQPIQAELIVNTHVKNRTVDAHSVLQTSHGKITGDLFIDSTTPITFRGQVVSKGLDFSDFNIPLSSLAFETHFSGTSTEIRSFTTKLTGLYNEQIIRAHMNYANQAFNGQINLGPNEMSFKGKQPYQVDLHAIIPQPELFHPTLKGLHTTIKANVSITNAHKGKATLTLSPGRFQLIQNKSMSALEFKGGKITAALTPKGLSAKGQLTIDHNKRLDLKASLPRFSLAAPDLSRQSISGNLNLTIDSLEFLNHISPDIEKTQGQITMKLSASGTIAKPGIEGIINLSNGSVYLPKPDLVYTPINLEIRTANNKWTAKGNIGSQNKNLSITGSGQLAPIESGQIKFLANEFPLMNTAEYSIFASPDLTIAFKPNAIDITGSILIPNAEIKPITFSQTKSLTEDAVFVSEKKHENPLGVTMDIDLKMGQQVKLDVKGLKGFLDGGIRIRQHPETDPIAIGELRIRDGKYKAYGQDLVIQDGQLMFTGGLIYNPGIRVRAVRYFNHASASFASSNEMFDFSSANLDTVSLGSKVTVGIELTGRVNNPEVKLFSIPSNLSQADILSMLILGKPSSQAGKSGGQLLVAAISAMDLDSGTKGAQLLNQLKSGLGLDINLERSSSYDQTTNAVNESTAFVVGKSITKRLYMSYNVGLFQNDGNVLSIKYLLNKYFSIQVTASDTGSGLDFLYNHTKD